MAQAFALTCQTSNCHQGIDAFKFRHSPLKTKEKGCTICHTVLENNGGSSHPKLKTLSIHETNNACALCHSEFIKKIKSRPHIHSAIEKNSCVACHSPHASNFPKMLKYDKKIELCLSCHQSFKIQNHHNFSNFKNGCLTCHSDHSSEQEKLLNVKKEDLCFTCHTSLKWQVLPKSNWHTPVKKGQCIACHDQHGSEKKALLRLDFVQKSYTKNLESDMALCLSCHHIKTDQTQFRNGERNLHQLHVFQSKKTFDQEKSCALCHEVHASSNLHLIKDSFEVFDFKMPIKFNPRPDGGSCATTCHKEFEYQRTRPYQNEIH